MDTTKEYIKMCGCEEIQNQKPSCIGLDRISRASSCSYGNGSNFWFTGTAGVDNFIWLPRQDQLQEMVCKTSYIPCFALTEWIGEQGDFDYELYTTEEQRWLAYVMKEKYNKTWNVNKWQT